MQNIVEFYPGLENGLPFIMLKTFQQNTKIYVRQIYVGSTSFVGDWKIPKKSKKEKSEQLGEEIYE